MCAKICLTKSPAEELRANPETNPLAASRKIGLARPVETRQQVLNQKGWEES
jgi:hypothetical protein